MKTTNVKPKDLNYTKYTTDQYDRDIVNAIPFHKNLHEHIANFVIKNFQGSEEFTILDLGVGTGITSKLLQKLLPRAKIDVIDFSKSMLARTKKKLGNKNVHYLMGDYATFPFNKRYDIIVSVIGIHHQNTQGKKNLFKKIYSLLKKNGVFIFGDLVTYTNPREAALNNARHYHHLVKHANNKKTLTDWAHHHMFLNNLTSIEDQIKWLSDAGFKVKKALLKMNTALLFCHK